MDPRYIFVVQCRNTQTWWLRPPTLLFEELIPCISYLRSWCSLLVLFLNLIREGTCIGFFVDLLLQCQVPRTTPCLLSHLSHPISRHLIFAHEFKFFIKITSIFENFEWISFWPSRPEYPPPWAEYLVGPDNLGHSGRIIRPGSDWVFKGRGRAALGQFLSPRRPRGPSRRHCLLVTATGAPAIPLARFRWRLLSSTLGGLSPSCFRNGPGYCSFPLSRALYEFTHVVFLVLVLH
jgi:hypothetical protein